MRTKAAILVLVLSLQLLAGCLQSDNQQDYNYNEINTPLESELNLQEKSAIFGGIIDQSQIENKIEQLNSIIQDNRAVNFNTSTIPRKGGNWTHYFVCSDGQKIDYFFPMPQIFTCKGGTEELFGEKYESTWISYRHREVISKIAINSAFSYFLTNLSQDGKLAVDILLTYAEFYNGLPVQDKFGNIGLSGGKLTRQSLDEAVLLIDIAWIYYIINPLLSEEQNLIISSNLISPMIETLYLPSNQNRLPVSNWFAYHNAAIAMAAVSLDNYSLLNQSLNQHNGFYFQIENGFDDDGFWHEGSIAYQNYTLNAMSISIEAAKYFGVNLANYSWQTSSGKSVKLSKPFTSHLNLVKPDGTFPRLNDDIRGLDLASVLPLLEFTNSYWPNTIPSHIMNKARKLNQEYSIKLLLWSKPLNNNSEQIGSVNYEMFGVSIIRHNDTYVLIDYGSHGGWHGHYDKLNVEITLNDSNLFLDPGTVEYSLPSSSEWYRNSFAHSIPFIDNRNQPETTGKMMNYDFSSNMSFVIAQYTDDIVKTNVTRLVLVLSTPQYGDIVFDASHWSGQIEFNVTQTYHFENTLPVIVDENYVPPQRFPNLGDYAQVDLINNEQNTYSINSIDKWSGYVIVSEGNSLHAGTSINGGTFLIQSSNNPTLNSTMFALYGTSLSLEYLDISVSSIGELSTVSFGEYSMTIDWKEYSITV